MLCSMHCSEFPYLKLCSFTLLDLLDYYLTLTMSSGRFCILCNSKYVRQHNRFLLVYQGTFIFKQGKTSRRNEKIRNRMKERSKQKNENGELRNRNDKQLEHNTCTSPTSNSHESKQIREEKKKQTRKNKWRHIYSFITKTEKMS